MSKKDELKDLSNSLVSGFVAPLQPQKEDTPKEVIKAPTNKKTTKYKNGSNLNNNYTITFKIDADIEDYLKNIEYITFIESAKSGKIKSKTKTEFVNDLIREQYYLLLGVSDDDTAEDINNKWQKYKNNKGL
jgi:hypothetical protein